MSEDLLTEVRGGVIYLTINREERRNAMNPEVLGGISTALDRVDADASIRCMVLTGAGEKA